MRTKFGLKNFRRYQVIFTARC